MKAPTAACGRNLPAAAEEAWRGVEDAAPYGERENSLRPYLYIIHSYHPAGAGNFLAACGPLGGLYTVLSFPPFSIIYQIPNDRA